MGSYQQNEETKSTFRLIVPLTQQNKLNGNISRLLLKNNNLIATMYFMLVDCIKTENDYHDTW